MSDFSNNGFRSGEDDTSYVSYRPGISSVYSELLESGADGNSFETKGSSFDPYMAITSPPTGFSTKQNRPPMQRYIEDASRASFFNPMPQSQLQSLAQPLTPLPALSQGRHGSPFSSSVHSPFGDSSEFYTDHNPSTPQDVAAYSPFQSTRCDEFDPSTQHFPQLGHYLPVVEDSCVSMTDVNPNLQHQFNFSPMDADLEFDGLQRSFSCESQDSTCQFDTEATAGRMPFLGNSSKHVSTGGGMQPVIKEELRVPGRASLIQSPTNACSSMSPKEALDDASEDGELGCFQAKSVDSDDEYQPITTRKAKTSSRSRRRPQTSKRYAPTRSLEKAHAKKPKTAPLPSQPAKILPPSPGGSKGSLKCPDCTNRFKDEGALHNHIKKQHNRPFVCVFEFAGCTSTFASKNEWKRHVNSQHLLLHYWLCDQSLCAHTTNGPDASSHYNGNKTSSRRGDDSANRRQANSNATTASPALPNGAIFNRKDLYTQHIRRMHTPAHIKEATRKVKKTSLPALASLQINEWEEHIKRLQVDAKRERCPLPVTMECPAAACSQQFKGGNAWDDRMEHVARHLEKAAAGEEEPLLFGGPDDASLMAWATRSDVAIVRPGVKGWEMNNPLRSDGSSGNSSGGRRQSGNGASSSSFVLASSSHTPSMMGDEDAECEDEF